jgi:transcriptional regulator with XRE-family HTH domain
LSRLHEGFSGKLLEAQNFEGTEWDVVLIEEGLSKNGNFYPAETLQDAVTRGLFEGAKAYAFELRRGLFDHLPPSVKQAIPQGFAGNLVGWYENARIREVRDPQGRPRKAVAARLHISENARWLRDLMRDAYAHGHGDLLGFSIDAQGATSGMLHEGRAARRVDRIERVDSVDVVTHAAAGGRVERLVASATDTGGDMNKKAKEILELVAERFPHLCEGFDGLKETKEEEAETMLLSLIETNKEKLDERMRILPKEELEEASRGMGTLDAILQLLMAKRFDEAIDLIKKWMAVYPQPEREAPRFGFYSFPYGKPGPDYPGPQGIRPYETGSGMTEARHRLGDFIKRRMEEKEITAEGLAKAAGITPAAVMQIVRGEIQRPPDERLRGFAKGLGVSFEHLLSLIPRELRESEGEAMEKDKDKEKEMEKDKQEKEKAGTDLAEAQKRLEEKIASLEDQEKRLKAQEQKLAIQESQTKVKQLLSDSGLPEPSKGRLSKLMEGKLVTEEEAQKAIEEERAYLATLSESGKIRGLGRPNVEVGADEQEKRVVALDGFFDHADGKTKSGTVVPRFRSFHEAYRHFGGDPLAEAKQILRESCYYAPPADRGNPFYRHLQESGLTTTWTEVLGDSIRRKMIREYEDPILNLWRQIVSEISNIKDFRTIRRMRIGGYGVLETVGEQKTYPNLTTPQDEEVTYAISKRGGIEDLTIEMVANDDVGAIRRIPILLGQAAIQTLYREVFDLLRLNKVIFDGKSVAHADHGNLSTNELSSDELDVARRAMRKQKAFGDDKKVLGSSLVPKWLLVAPDRERLATQISTSVTLIGATGNAATEPNLHRGIQVLVIDYWDDPKDWWVVADPRRVPTIEVGFWNGREEPELFVQDQPTVGSVFTADKISYKIRHVWGLAVLEFRGFFGGIVP